MSELKFPDGLRAFKPNEKAPFFVKANLVINRAELMNWLENQPEKIRLDLLESKSTGSYYLKIDDYQPQSN